ncbi:hypothetical protein LINPERPRIM_LOCUS42798 [Linum perenne]
MPRSSYLQPRRFQLRHRQPARNLQTSPLPQRPDLLWQTVRPIL